MITYFWKSNNVIQVKLDGRIIGTIKPKDGGFAYYPKGWKESGDVFKTISEVKRSIESE